MPIMELRGRLEEIKDGQLPDLGQELKRVAKETSSLLEHFGSQGGDIAQAVRGACWVYGMG